jgi:galactokinase
VCDCQTRVVIGCFHLCHAVAREGGFWSYAAGTAWRVAVHHDVGGLELDVWQASLPMGKGLSSSAAACVLARALRCLEDTKAVPSVVF